MTVARVDIAKTDEIVATCRRGRERQAIPILDLPLPAPRPPGAEWIDAYLLWARGSYRISVVRPSRPYDSASGGRSVKEATTSVPRLTEVLKRLINAYEPERVYLFGSNARGDAGPCSDYDLLLVVPDDATPERKRSRLAYECLWGTGISVDVLVWTRTSFDRRLHLPASLPATVIREGRLLHAA